MHASPCSTRLPPAIPTCAPAPSWIPGRDGRWSPSRTWPPKSGQDYDLWAIHDSQPASLGIIPTNERGNPTLRVDDIGDPATLRALAVSLEPVVLFGT